MADRTEGEGLDWANEIHGGDLWLDWEETAIGADAQGLTRKADGEIQAALKEENVD